MPLGTSLSLQFNTATGAKLRKTVTTMKILLKNTLKPNKMAHIKEPEGVDFIIQSPPLTDVERKEISDLIKRMKSKSQKSSADKRERKKGK